MSLRVKTLTLLGIALGCLAACLYFAMQNTVLADFDQLEAELAEQSADRAAGLCRNELSALDAVTTDWAWWDDCAAFVTTGGETFRRSNLVPSTFTGLHVDVLVVTDAQGKVHAALQYDRAKEALRPAPDAAVKHAVSLSRPGTIKPGAGVGLLASPDWVLLFAARPIRDSSGEGPDRGAVLFGRYLDDAKITQWSQQANARLTSFRVGALDAPGDVVAALTELTVDHPSCALLVNGERIGGYALLADVAHSPVVVLRTLADRSVHRRAVSVVRYVGLVLTTLVICFGLLLLAFVERTVLSRVARLSADVTRIGASADATARVAVSGRDELGRLSEATNDMLAALERAHRQRIESERRYQSVVTQASEGIFVAALDTGRVLEANPALLRLLGCEDQPLPPLRLEDVLGGSFAAAERLRRELPAAGDLVLETEFVRTDGLRVPVEASFSLLAYEGHEALCAVVRDVTARVKAEEERRRFEAQMLHTQKLESLGVLAGGIAHDFNNLLTGILGNAGLALMMIEPDSTIHGYVQRIETAGHRAAELISQLLAYAGKATFREQTVDLAALVTEMAELLRLSISKQAELRLDFDAGLPAVRGDATQLRQVVMNLITNASDALGGQPGVVGISAEVAHVDHAWLLDAHLREDLPEGVYVRVAVTDTGSGMEEATRERIFDPFYTTKFAGRGLGLAAVLGIVRGHGGAIRVTSQLGSGTTVEVLLPCERPAEEALPAPEPVARPEFDTRPLHATVLVIDDEEGVANVAAAALEHAGCQVLVAYGGAAGVAEYASQPDDIDAVLLDLTMPGMSGPEVLARLLELRPAARVILSSGFREPEQEGLAVTGHAAFLQKPYHPGRLIGTLRQVLGRSDLDDEPAGG